MKGDRKFAPLFRVVWIDAWAEGESEWTWNDSRELFEFRTSSLNLKRAFTSRLRHYLKCKVYNGAGLHESHDLGRGWYYVTDDWDVMELRKICNNEPVYACIRMTPSH